MEESLPSHSHLTRKKADDENVEMLEFLCVSLKNYLIINVYLAG